MCTYPIIWLFGRPCSGKSTLSQHLKPYIIKKYDMCHILDGDDFRSVNNTSDKFSLEDRRKNLAKAAGLAKAYSFNLPVICSFISPTQSIREEIRAILSPCLTKYIYVYSSIETCIARDVKGMYKKALLGEITDFTGISSPFDEPMFYDTKLNTEALTVDDCIRKILQVIDYY